MLAILGSIITEVMAGLIVWSLTEGRSNGGGSTQIINIQNAYFFDDVREMFPSSRRSSSSSSGDDLLGMAIVAMIVIVTFVAGIATIYVNFIDAILTVGYWVAIFSIAFGVILLIAGYFYLKNYLDNSAILLASFCFLMSLAFAGLVWMVYSPLSPPQDYEKTFALLQQIPIGADGWLGNAFNIGLNHWEATQFLFWQSIGILPAFIAIIIVLYTEVRLIFVMKNLEKASFQTWAMYGAPSLALVASICLGLFGKG